MMSLEGCSTIQNLIDYSKTLELSHEKLFLKEAITDTSGNIIVINYTSLVDKYSDVISKVTKEITLTDDEYMKYRFNPKRFCYDMYKTIELSGILLKINNMTSVTQFTEKKIKAFNIDIFDLLNEILILEKEEIDTANNKINNMKE